GPNGAGKTTLLLVLATLLVPDAGEVRVAGYDPVTDADAVRARMGWAPDVFGLYDNLTAGEYLIFVGESYRMSRPRAKERAGELLATARLSEYVDRPVHTLSRGQKQRLGLARAVVHEPEVLLLDEPASGLDPRSRVELRDLLREFARRGTAVIVSSHLLGDLEELADRVVFVDKGTTVGEHRLDQLPTGTATRPWRLRALDMEALVQALGRNGYDADEPTIAGVDVQLASDEAAAELIAALVRGGVALVACQPLGGALEATYLELTT
ncbi:MAG: ABC transporter ATP-binding protein, partial [Mycobacteriales bacterium]